jgi:hypothetical protein
MPMDYSVSLWLTHPDLGNDDCMTGTGFATEADARAELAALLSGCSTRFDMAYHRDCAFAMVDGPGCCEVVERPGVAARSRREARLDAENEQSEVAMQAGMELGVEGYNDAMGW